MEKDDLGPKIEGAANCIYPKITPDELPRFISRCTPEDEKNFEKDMADQQRLEEASSEILEITKNWVDWYQRQYGPLGLTPGRMLWEQTRDIIKRIERK